MSNDYDRGYNDAQQTNWRTENELDKTKKELAYETRHSGSMARLARNRIKELEAALAEAQATIAKQDEQLTDWMASQKAMKRLAIKLIEEGASHPDKEAHPLANSKEKRDEIFRPAYHEEYAKLKPQQ